MLETSASDCASSGGPSRLRRTANSSANHAIKAGVATSNAHQNSLVKSRGLVWIGESAYAAANWEQPTNTRTSAAPSPATTFAVATARKPKALRWYMESHESGANC